MRILFYLVTVVTVVSLSLPSFRKFQESFGEPLDHSSASHDELDGHHADGNHKEASHHEEGGEHHAKHKILVTSPVRKDITLTQQYVCQIRSCRHIDVCALEGGYLQNIGVREGQTVKQGDKLFNILPTLYQAKLDADLAEAQLAQVEYDNTRKLMEQGIVSIQELKLSEARLAKANATVKLAQAEVNFADIRAPFDGIVDRLMEQKGSLIEEGAILTTLSDNSTMWVYFNLPEARYLEYQAAMNGTNSHSHLDVKLKLANHKMFPHDGVIGAIEADFNNETGNIAFRADFPNPDGLLRNGQTGNILINQVEEDAIVIPQRATYEILAKKYAFVVDEHHVVHQREIVIQHELEDIYVIESGLSENDKIILEGIRQVRDGETVEYELVDATEIMSNLKYHAE